MDVETAGYIISLLWSLSSVPSLTRTSVVLVLYEDHLGHALSILPYTHLLSPFVITCSYCYPPGVNIVVFVVPRPPSELSLSVPTRSTYISQSSREDIGGANNIE